MNSAQEFLSSKLITARNQIIAGCIVIGIFCIYFYFMVSWYSEGMRDPETDEFAPPIVNVLIGILLLGGLFLINDGYKLRKRYLIYAKGKSIEFEDIITDKYIYYELLPGDQGAIKNRYYMQMGGHSWRLQEDCEYSFNYPILSKVKGIALSWNDSFEIIKINPVEIKNVIPIENGKITQKVVSELEIKGIKDTNFLFNRMNFINRKRFYVSTSNQIKEVTEDAFYNAKTGSTLID